MDRENSPNEPQDRENSTTSVSSNERMSWFYTAMFGSDCVPLTPESVEEMRRLQGTTTTTTWDGPAPKLPAHWRRGALLVLLGWGLGAISGALLLAWVLNR